MAELLFWPALLLYGEAAVGYFGDVRRPGLAGRAATWGVRLGWLAQTALLGVQAARDDGFPWGTWASSLALFVWLVVSAYLIWGCRRPYRLLGLVVMPLAVALLVVARAGGGTGIGSASHYSNLFLVVHVGLVLAAFAGFTLAAALSGLYIWQERRLRTRPATILRRQMPALATLDSLALRTVAWSVPLLTLGAAVGLVRLVVRDDRLDALIAVTAATWLVWCAYLALRVLGGWTGRRAAYLALRGLRTRRRRPARPPCNPLRMMRLVLVGTSHHHAPVELREQVALDREDAQALAARLAADGREAVCLSTCNRMELYIAADDAEQAERDAVAALASLSPEVEPALYRLQDRAAAHHLFRVAAGLDSLVPGEGEILGQVRVAHELGTTGPLLDRVFRQALHAGGRCVPRPRSARARPRCRQRPPRSPSRCSAASRAARYSFSARAR